MKEQFNNTGNAAKENTDGYKLKKIKTDCVMGFKTCLAEKFSKLISFLSLSLEFDFIINLVCLYLLIKIARETYFLIAKVWFRI